MNEKTSEDLFDLDFAKLVGFTNLVTDNVSSDRLIEAVADTHNKIGGGELPPPIFEPTPSV